MVFEPPNWGEYFADLYKRYGKLLLIILAIGAIAALLEMIFPGFKQWMDTVLDRH